MTPILKRKPINNVLCLKPIVKVINSETKKKVAFHDFEEAQNYIENHETPYLLECEFSRYLNNVIKGREVRSK